MIRLATAKDIDQLMGIENACFSRPYSVESFLSDIEGDKVKVFVEDNAGELLAFISVYVFLDEANLQQIAVLEKYRKKGIASNLIEYAVNYLTDAKVKRFYLEVNENNLIAIKVYEKLGFKKVITRKNYYGNQSAIVYERLL